jgi:hypothetical protein
MVNAVIVYHSSYGHTKNQAEAVLPGVASVAGVNGSDCPCLPR